MNLENMIKTQFSAAFEDLLRTTSFKNITVSSIIRKADLSRSTFYKYFRDKYDLAFWSLKKGFRTIKENVQQNTVY